MSERRRTISLVELTAVFAILVISVALLIPTLRHARSADGHARHVRTLKSFAIASFNYTGSYSGFTLNVADFSDHGLIAYHIDREDFRRISGTMSLFTRQGALFNSYHTDATVNAGQPAPFDFSLDMPEKAVFHGTAKSATGQAVHWGTISLLAGTTERAAAVIDSELQLKPARGRPIRGTTLALRNFTLDLEDAEPPNIIGSWSAGSVLRLIISSQDASPETGFRGTLSYATLQGTIVFKVLGTINDDGQLVLIGQEAGGGRVFVEGEAIPPEAPVSIKGHLRTFVGGTRDTDTFEAWLEIPIG